jgi:small redox-active disulfide protein 2
MERYFRGGNMKLQVLGPGCPSCEKLASNAAAAARELNLDFKLEKVKDMQKIMEFGVMITPALVVNGEVKSVGRIQSVEEIKKLLR